MSLFYNDLPPEADGDDDWETEADFTNENTVKSANIAVDSVNLDELRKLSITEHAELKKKQFINTGRFVETKKRSLLGKPGNKKSYQRRSVAQIKDGTAETLQEVHNQEVLKATKSNKVLVKKVYTGKRWLVGESKANPFRPTKFKRFSAQLREGKNSAVEKEAVVPQVENTNTHQEVNVPEEQEHVKDDVVEHFEEDVIYEDEYTGEYQDPGDYDEDGKKKEYGEYVQAYIEEYIEEYRQQYQEEYDMHYKDYAEEYGEKVAQAYMEEYWEEYMSYLDKYAEEYAQEYTQEYEAHMEEYKKDHPEGYEEEYVDEEQVEEDDKTQEEEETYEIDDSRFWVT